MYLGNNKAVSLMFALSKLVETIIKNRTGRYFDKCDILGQTQSSFLGRSVTNLLVLQKSQESCGGKEPY